MIESHGHGDAPELLEDVRKMMKDAN